MLAPVAADLIAPLVTVSGTNAVAVGSGPTDEDAPASARSEVLTAGAGDEFATRLVPAETQATLAAAYLGSRLVLITGTSGAGQACCSSASTEVADGGELNAPEPLVSGLNGSSTGLLVPVRGGLIAAVDNQAGITAARSDASGTFGADEPLVAANVTPPLMAAGPLEDGGALVAWTAPASPPSGYDQPRNRLIEYATAGPRGAPGRVKPAVTVPAGRQIDALQVIPHGAGVTLGWTESWYVGDRYESRVFWSDVSRAGAGPAHIVSSPASPVWAAVGLSGAGSPAGGEVLSWQACDIGAGTCVTESSLRPPDRDWGTPRSLGSVDPTSFPVAAQSRAGASVVAWISHGVVRAASAAPGAAGFSPTVAVSRTHDASDVALSFGAGTRAAAVWVQGTFDQKLVGARFSVGLTDPKRRLEHLAHRRRG